MTFLFIFSYFLNVRWLIIIFIIIINIDRSHLFLDLAKIIFFHQMMIGWNALLLLCSTFIFSVNWNFFSLVFFLLSNVGKNYFSSVKLSIVFLILAGCVILGVNLLRKELSKVRCWTELVFDDLKWFELFFVNFSKIFLYIK